jgi:hypothetical protein
VMDIDAVIVEEREERRRMRVYNDAGKEKS